MKYFKKIACVTAIAIIATASIRPLPAQAVWGAGDIALDPVQDASGIAQTVGQVTEIVNMVQGVLKEFGLDVVIYKLAQQASQKLIAKVLNHQTGGSSGWDIEYNFVDNFGKHFQNLNDQEFAKFTQALDNDTSNPYSKYISRAMVENHANGGNPLGQFSLDKIPGVNDWEQASSDIESAGSSGWDFYSQLSNPVNTPIGSAIIAQDQLAKQIAQKTEIAKTELTSSGFKPDKGSGCSSSPDLFSGIMGNNGGMGGSQAQPCSSADVKTPSSIGGSQSAQATGEAFERLRNSDELGKILMNTISQLITGLIKKGFSSLNSDGGSSPKLYGGPQDLAKLLNNQNASWSSAPQQVVDLKSELDDAIVKTELELHYMNQSVDLVKAPVVGTVSGVSGVAVKLEACIPGPDTDFDTRLQDYVVGQMKDTQLRAGEDGEKGSNNANAITIITRQSKQASEETKLILSNPFLNIPGAVEMRGALSEFYKLSSQFHGMIDTVILKRQTLNSLQTLKAQVMAYVPGLVLFDSQWNALSPSAKTQLYASLTPKIHAAFPEYANPDQPTNANVLSLLPADNPLTTDVNEQDAAMKKRIFDEQWDEWETAMTATPSLETKRDQLYAQYVSLGRDISDSSTVQNTKLKMESAQHQADELKLILDDCLILRGYAANNGSFPIPQAIKDSLATDRIKSVVDGPSIFNAAQNGININDPNLPNNLNERIIQTIDDMPGLTGATFSGDYGKEWRDSDPANKLQQDLPATPAELIQQDDKGLLFCRLTRYHQIYWGPSPYQASLTGKPIGCAERVMTIKGGFPNSVSYAESDAVQAIQPSGLPTTPKKFDAHWYHVNAAEILFNMSGER